MIKILCPTDFSDHAKRALIYAVDLANLLEAEIHLITAYKVPSATGSIISISRTIEENRILELKDLVAEVKSMIKTGKDPIIVAAKGVAPAVISNYVSHHEIDLVVMGTQGDGSVKNILLGSVTRKVAKKLHVPLLAVPAGADFSDLLGKQLILALDSKQVEEVEVFRMPMLLAEKLPAKIDVLHVAKNKDDLPVDPFALKHIEKYTGELILKESFFPLVEINNHLSENAVGMLIMIRRERSFIENLFLKGFTEEELGLTSTPLMVLPEHLS